MGVRPAKGATVTAVQDILNDLPFEQLAAQVGSDPQTVQQLSAQLIPALLGGMSANAGDPGGERSLTTALHAHASSGLAGGGIDVKSVDTADGEAIVHNVFGDTTGQVTEALGQQVAGGNSELVQHLLKILAPIVLAYLAKRLTGGPAGGTGAGSGAGAGNGSVLDILGDLLGGALGGRSGGPSPQPVPSGGDLFGDILGGLLGRGRRS